MDKSIIINGEKYAIDVDNDMPLLWFLRDRIEKTILFILPLNINVRFSYTIVNYMIKFT